MHQKLQEDSLTVGMFGEATGFVPALQAWEQVWGFSEPQDD